MNIQNATIRGRGMAQQNGLPPGKPYRYHGRRGWDPAKNLAKPVRMGNQSREGKLARLAAFRRLREDGKTIAEASEAIGVTYDTGRAYDKELAGGES